MGFVGAINFFLTLFVDTARRLTLWRVWLLLLAYFLFHWLILFAHYKFYSPFFYGMIQPWASLLNPQSAVGFTHYPGHFLTLPYFFSWARFFLSVPVEGLVLGMVALLIYDSFVGRQGLWPNSLKQWSYLWVQLVFAWLAVYGLMLLLDTYLPELLRAELYRAPRRLFVFHYLFLPAVHVVLLALFYYVLPYAAVNQAGFLRAVRRSLEFFRDNPLLTLFLAAVILAVPVVFSVVILNLGSLVERFQPEIVYSVILVGLVADIFVKFFWMGSAVRFLVERD